MKLEKWALLAEILSASAVVSSLVFVGLQVRQGAEETALNTRAIQVNAYQNLTAQLSTVNSLVIENSDLAEAFSRIYQPDAPVSELAEIKLRSLMTLIYRHGEMAFVQYQNGLISENQLISMLVPVMAVVASELGREIWDSNPALSSEFKRYVENLAASVDSR